MNNLENIFKARLDEMSEEFKNESKKSCEVKIQTSHVQYRKLIQLKDGYVFNVRDDYQ